MSLMEFELRNDDYMIRIVEEGREKERENVISVGKVKNKVSYQIIEENYSGLYSVKMSNQITLGILDTRSTFTLYQAQQLKTPSKQRLGLCPSKF